MRTISFKTGVCSKNRCQWAFQMNQMTVAKKIIEHEIDSIPVVEEIENKTKIVGKISKTNITKLFLEIVDN